MFVDLSDKKVIVVGAGTIAKRRIRTLIEFTDHLVVIAPEVNKELLDLEKEGRLTILRKRYQREDIFDASMVIAATNDRKLNDEIHRICKQEGIYVNVASDRDQCDFYFPGLYMQDELVVGITASGLNHKKARRIREEIQKALEKVAQEDDEEDDD